MQTPTSPQKPAQPVYACPDCRCSELRRVTIAMLGGRKLEFWRCADCGIAGEPIEFEVVEREATNG